MLSTTLRPDESIRLYTSEGVVEIYLSKIKGNQARIGIDAPKSIKIIRSEFDAPKPKNPIWLPSLLGFGRSK